MRVLTRVGSGAMLLLLLVSCRVQFVADYDGQLATQIENAAEAVDYFYLSMAENTADDFGARSYQYFKEDYLKIEVQLNSILRKNRIQPLNEHSTKIAQMTLDKWVEYKKRHKDKDGLSDAEIKLNRLTMSDFFYAMLVAEEGKKLANP